MALIDSFVNPVLEKYNIPKWVRPYVLKYVRKNPANTVKFATSFFDIKRRRGEVTKDHIRLPNGLTFKKEHVLRVLSLFFHGEESTAKMASAWAGGRAAPSQEYTEHFSEMETTARRHARAIKNLIEGLGRKPERPQRELMEVFSYVSGLDSWYERVLATELVLKDSYARAFGTVFYRVFYPVSPEFMRSFGKAFADEGQASTWGDDEARRIIANKLVTDQRAVELTRSILARVLRSIDANMRLARSSGIENEARLLTDIAIAYPFHSLAQLGVRVNVENEIKNVKRESRKLRYQFLRE